jgi:hypothetical protein
MHDVGQSTYLSPRSYQQTLAVGSIKLRLEEQKNGENGEKIKLHLEEQKNGENGEKKLFVCNSNKSHIYFVENLF